MILTNHGRHLSDAFEDLRDSFSEIKVFTTNGDQASLNMNLLKLFSPFLRGILASIPQDSAPTLIMPDSSGLAIRQISNIFSSGVTGAGIISYKDINDIVEAGKLFGLDLTRISYEQNMLKENSPVIGGDSCYPVSKESGGDDDILLSDDAPLDRSAQLLETMEEVAAEEFLDQLLSEASEVEVSKRANNLNKIVKENESKVKQEAPDNLLSFCEGIKGLIGKSLGIEMDTIVKREVPALSIKQETYEENDNGVPEVYDDVESDEELQIPSSQISQQSAQVQGQHVDMMYQPMQIPINMPMAPSMHMYPNSFTMETPPPDLFPGYHQNMVPRLPQPQPAGTIFISQEEYQSKLMEFQNFRNERQEQQPLRKKVKQAFICSRCKVYETPHAEHLRKHLPACKRLNPKATSLDCRICQFTAKNPVKYHTHIRDEHLELVTACEHCEFTTFHNTQMRKHIYQYHNWANVPNQMTQPGPVVQNSLDVGEHYSCRKCDYVGPHLKALQQHTSMKHEKGNGGKPNSTENISGQKHVSSWRKEMGWGADDKFTCDFWNFVGKGKCRMENGHKDDGKLKVPRHHICALCFRNIGQKKSHPAAFCRMFPLPVKEQGVTTHQAGEKGPSMADQGISRGPSREAISRGSSREEEMISAREEGEEVDSDS